MERISLTDPAQRLKWQRDEGGRAFIAYPFGADRKGFKATLRFGRPPGKGREGWLWSVSFDHWAAETGYNDYRKLAVEAVNKAWQVVKVRGEALRDEAGHRSRLAYNLTRVAARNVVTIEDYRISEQTSDRLLWMIRECSQRVEVKRARYEDCRAIEALMLAISTELHRRRITNGG